MFSRNSENDFPISFDILPCFQKYQVKLYIYDFLIIFSIKDKISRSFQEKSFVFEFADIFYMVIFS